MSIQYTDSPRAIRERLRFPPNAVPDRPIDLSRPVRGVNGEQAIIELARARIERLERLQTLTETSGSISGYLNEQNHAYYVDSAKVITIEMIQKEIILQSNISRTELFSERRPKRLSEPRHIAIALSRELTKRSLPEIGRRFCRDHTSVLNAVRKKLPLIQSLRERGFVKDGRLGAPLKDVVRAALEWKP